MQKGTPLPSKEKLEFFAQFADDALMIIIKTSFSILNQNTAGQTNGSRKQEYC